MITIWATTQLNIMEPIFLVFSRTDNIKTSQVNDLKRDGCLLQDLSKLNVLFHPKLHIFAH